MITFACALNLAVSFVFSPLEGSTNSLLERRSKYPQEDCGGQMRHSRVAKQQCGAVNKRSKFTPCLCATQQ